MTRIVGLLVAVTRVTPGPMETFPPCTVSAGELPTIVMLPSPGTPWTTTLPPEGLEVIHGRAAARATDRQRYARRSGCRDRNDVAVAIQLLVDCPISKTHGYRSGGSGWQARDRTERAGERAGIGCREDDRAPRAWRY